MTIKKIIYSALLLLILGGVWLTYFHTDTIKPFLPFRIAGNLYYVGNNYLASYLIVTPQGNILISSNYENNVPMLEASIENLGFHLSDTKILLINHAHSDHGAGSALIKKKARASYQVMDADVPVVESGGKADFQYGNDLYPPTKVDRILHDGDEVKLGGTVLIAHLTPGHTKGCTTWTMKIAEKGKKYNVVIVGGPYVNPGYKLIHNTAYPTIAQDYEHMFHVLNSLPCDIFLGAHGGYFGLKEKYDLMSQGKTDPFVDQEGYKKFVAQKEQDFHAELGRQKARK